MLHGTYSFTSYVDGIVQAKHMLHCGVLVLNLHQKQPGSPRF